MHYTHGACTHGACTQVRMALRMRSTTTYWPAAAPHSLGSRAPSVCHRIFRKSASGRLDLEMLVLRPRLRTSVDLCDGRHRLLGLLPGLLLEPAPGFTAGRAGPLLNCAGPAAAPGFCWGDGLEETSQSSWAVVLSIDADSCGMEALARLIAATVLCGETEVPTVASARDGGERSESSLLPPREGGRR
jgi:hypothetical protein